MKIINERERVTTVWYERCFESRPHCGFGFPCDENGNVWLDEMSEAAIANYNSCIAGEYTDLQDIGVRKYETTHIEPATGICDNCGSEIQLVDEYYGACECECGAWYNLFGQSINPPRMWEEPIDYDY